MMPRSASCAILSGLFTLACSASDDPGGSGQAGSSGNGNGNGNGGECIAEGRGTLVVQVVGLPDGVEPGIDISGPDATSPSGPGTHDDLSAGVYTVLAAPVADGDAIVRTLYAPSVPVASACVTADTETVLAIHYAPVPSSNKLWMASGSDAEIVAFGSADLGVSAAFDAPVAIQSRGGRDLTFDRAGNLWALGSTLIDPMLVRFDAAELGESGEIDPSISIDVSVITCVPAVRSLAFDRQGDLWLSACGGQVMRLAGDALESGEVDPDLVLSGFDDNQGLAFDHDGNLWVAEADRLVRYDASRLSASGGAGPDLGLTVSDPLDAAPRAAYRMAFDRAGNLWGLDFDSNVVFMVAESALQGSGSQQAEADVSIAIDAAALLEGLAFDESHGLWITLDRGRFGRLSAAQLSESSSAGAPTVPEVTIQSSSIANAAGLAFFPAAAGLPLYHAVR